MITTQLKRVRRLFNSDWIPREHNRAYQRKWVRQIRQLGDNWLLAWPITKEN